jgi:hypothetical protein
MRQYHEKSIYDVFKISFIDFMELPKDVVEMLFHIGNEINAKKQKQLSEIESQFSK